MPEFKNDRIWIFIEEEIPGLDQASGFVRRDDCGAVNLFEGVTRNHDSGRKVDTLYYDAYPEMAIEQLRKIAEKLCRNFEIGKIAVLHKTGEVPVGYTSMITAISAPHRKDAVHATLELIKQLKTDVPIWKKETFDHGSAWKEEQQ